jgi:hypothetical protein
VAGRSVASPRTPSPSRPAGSWPRARPAAPSPPGPATCSRWFCRTSRIEPDAVVEAAAALDADRLAHRDLHAAHVVAVPHRLEQGVREAEHQQVLDALLAEVVVDAEDALLGEHAVQGVVQLLRAGESRPNGFSTTIRPRSLSPTDASSRRPWGTSTVGSPCRTRRACCRVLVEGEAQRLPGGRIGVVALDQVEPLHQRLDRRGLGVGDRLQDRVVRVLAERLVGPVAAGHADHGDLRRCRGARAGTARGTACAWRGRRWRRTARARRRWAGRRCSSTVSLRQFVVAAELRSHRGEHLVGDVAAFA